MKFLSSLLILISVAWLSACAPLPYKKAEGPGVATLKMTNASSNWIMAMESQQGDCRDMQYWGGTIDRIERGQDRMTHALPGRMFVFNVNGMVGFGYNSISSCPFTMGMYVEQDGEYELRYSGTSDGCRIESWQRIGSTWKPVALKKYKLHNLIGPQSCTLATAP